MEIGVINQLRNEGKCFDHVAQFGLKVCQLNTGDSLGLTNQIAETVKAESARVGVRVCAVWAGWPGPGEWNFTGGPVTLGLVPPQYRQERLKALKDAADFAVAIGVPAIITHCGFIPENLTDPEFGPVVAAIREISEYCQDRSIGFWFETGQETPITLLRTITEVGTDNLGINLDPANLLLYGRGNPIDALDVFGRHVKNVHVKDGFYPTDGNQLGQEVPVGQGKVNFPLLLQRLHEVGFDGELIIEREIPEGEEQSKDIQKTVDDLRAWISAIT